MIVIPYLAKNHQWAKALATSKPKTYHHIQEFQSFTPMYAHGLEGDIVDVMFNTLFPKVGNNAIKGKRQALQSALLSLAQCAVLSTDTSLCTFIHKRTTQHQKDVKRYKDRDFSNKVFTTILDELATLGYVRYEKGFKGEDAGTGLATVWIVCSPFIDWVIEHLASLKVISFREYNESLVLKDSKSRVDYLDNETTRGMRQRLDQSNLLREQHSWSYTPLDRNYWDMSGTKRVFRQFVLDDMRSKLGVEGLRCHRVFNGDFETGGRFYCNAQNLAKIERQTITINGQPTVELDYKSLHPRMLYNLEGLEAPFDCYASNNKDRALTKRISLLVVNSESRKQAKSRLMLDYKCTADEANGHLDDYIDEHPQIAHRFFKSGWKQLQYLDSQLVDAVLEMATIKGIPVLPVHDSFIVATEWAFWVKEQTITAYRDLMGFDAVIDWS
jgi:hypothetical protein